MTSDDSRLLPNIHILGIQGSGKGTQSSLLVEQFGLSYVSSGNLFRERASEGDTHGDWLKAELAAGHLIPDVHLFQIVCAELENPIPKGLLADGVIRTPSQYDGWEQIWPTYGLEAPLLFYLQLDETTALERLEKRAKVDHRTDDTPESIRERFRQFHELTEPVIARFDEAGRCITIDASRTVDVIQNEIREEVIRHFPNLANVTH